MMRNSLYSQQRLCSAYYKKKLVIKRNKTKENAETNNPRIKSKELLLLNYWFVFGPEKKCKIQNKLFESLIIEFNYKIT